MLGGDLSGIWSGAVLASLCSALWRGGGEDRWSCHLFIVYFKLECRRKKCIPVVVRKSEWPVAEWPKEALCLWSIFLPKEVYFWPWKKYKLRKKLIFRQNHLWITPFLTNNFREIFYQFYIPCTRLQSCRHHLTLIFDKSFSAEFQWKIFYFFGIFSL